MAGAFKHRFPSPIPDELVTTEVGPDEWNDSLVMSGGNDGDFAVRRTALADGWELIKLGASLAFINVTQAGNSGAGETDLHVYTLPAGHLAVNKKGMRLTATGSFAANANTKTLRLKLGAGVNITLNAGTPAPNNKRFEVEVAIFRTASNAQVILVKTFIEGVALDTISKTVGAETDANALTLKITGQGTANNDILLDVTSIEFLN
jgi:hypothetical protein